MSTGSVAKKKAAKKKAAKKKPKRRTGGIFDKVMPSAGEFPSIEDAVDQIEKGEDISAAYSRIYGGMMQGCDFRAVHARVRENNGAIPEGLQSLHESVQEALEATKSMSSDKAVANYFKRGWCSPGAFEAEAIRVQMKQSKGG